MNDLEKLSVAVNLLRSNILCPICLEPLQNAVSTRCNHHFCSDCYNKLITINRTAYCPMCHSKVNRRTVLKDTVLARTVQAVSSLLKSIEQDSGIDFTEALPLPQSTREAVCGTSSSSHSKQTSSVSQLEEVPITKPSKPEQATSGLHAEKIPTSHQEIQQESVDTPKIFEDRLHLCNGEVPEISPPKQSTCELITIDDSVNIPSNSIERETKDKNAKTNADGWLKRYKKQYSGRAPPVQLDESLLFPAELIHPPPKVKKRPRANLDVSKVTTEAKVQNWLELNEDNLEECENMSILTGSLPRRITVEADVHNSPSDEEELLSVSQLPPKDTIIHVPRAVNYAILPGVDEIETLEPTPSENRPETSEPEVSKLMKPKKVSEVKEVIGKSVETNNIDPYEFISSQKSQNNIKQKRKPHKKTKFSKKSKEPLWNDISMYIKETYSNKRSKQDAKVTEASFLAPVSINDTFDNLLAEYRKNLTDEVCGDSLSNTKNLPVNDPSTGTDMKNELVHKNENELKNATIYKSQTDSAAVEWDATPEAFDFSSGSDEEWMETRKRTRKTQRQSKPFKVFDPASRLGSRLSRRQSKQLGTSKQKERNSGDITCNKRQSRPSFTLKQKVEEENDVLESINGLFKEIDDHKLLTSSQVEREALAVDSAANQTTPDINSKDSHQAKHVNTETPNIYIKEQDHPSDNIGRKSSPGWSHLVQLKKDFKGPKKPTLKALDVSMGSSSSKKNVSFTVPNNENQIAELETPVVIDDGSIVGIGSVNEINNSSEKVIFKRNQEEQDKKENAHLPGKTHEELTNDKTCGYLIDKNGHVTVEEAKAVINNRKEASPEPQTFITSSNFQSEKKHHRRRASFNQDLVLSDSVALCDPIVTEDVQERNCNDMVQTAIDNSTADITEVVPTVLDKQECSTAEQFTQHSLENPGETGPIIYVNSIQRDRAASDLSTSSCELVGYSEEPNALCKMGVMKDIINTLEHEIINVEEAISKRQSQVNHILSSNLPSQLIVPESESASSEEKTCGRENESKFTNSSEQQSQGTEVVPDSLDIGMDADEICKTPALVLRRDCRTTRMQPEESTDRSTMQPVVGFYKLGSVRPLNRTFFTQFIYRGSLAPKRKRKVSRTNTTGSLSQEDDSQIIPFITWEQNEEEEPLLKKRCRYSAQDVHLKRCSLVAANGNQKIHSHKEVAAQTSQKCSEPSIVVQACQKVSSPQTVSVQTSQKMYPENVEVQTSQKTLSLQDIGVQTSQEICSVEDVEVQTSQQTHSHCVANVQTSPSIRKIPTVDCEVQVSSSHRNVLAQTSPTLFKIPAEPSVQPQNQAVEVQTTQSLHRVLDDRNKEFALEEDQISPSVLDQPFEDIPIAEECAKHFSHTDHAKEYNLQSGSITDSEFQLAEVALNKNLDLDSSHKKNESVEIIYDHEKHKVNRQLNFKEPCVSPAKSISGNSDAQNSKSSKTFKRIRHMSSSESGDEVETEKLMVTKKGKTNDERSLGVKPFNQVIEVKSDSEPDVVSSENFIPGTYESPKKAQTEEEEDVECLNSEELLQKIMDNIDEDIGILEKKTSQNEKSKCIPKSVCDSDIDSEKNIGPSKDKRIVSPAQNLEPRTADMFSLTRKESESVISQVQSTGVGTKTDDIFSDTERESERIISQPRNFEVGTAEMFSNTRNESAGITLQEQSIEPKIADMFSRSKKEPENSPPRKMKSNTDVQKPVPNESVILEESMSDCSDVVEATPKKSEASSVRARSSNSGGRESLQHAVQSIASPKTKPTSRAVHAEVELPQVVKHPAKSPQKISSNKVTVLTATENSPKPADRILSPRRSTRSSPRKSTVSTPGKEVLARSKSAQQPVFVCSGLTPPLISKVKAAAVMLGAKFCDIFVFEMSHLIVKVDENNAAEKTLKYLQAVASGKWVVSYAWIVACMEAKRLLPEDEYEAVDSMGFDGPRRSRTRTAPLFNNFQFCCIPPFSIITVDKLQEILMLCGGIVVTSPRDFRRKANTFLICVIETESTASEETYGRWLDQYGVVSVGSDWVLDCIGSYCIFSLWPYLMFSVSRERLQALGYSEEMLLSEDENEDDVSAAV